MASSTVALTQAQPQVAHRIAPSTHAEAGRLAAAELERIIKMVESLEGEDWTQQTDCALWNVRDMVAHLSGACAAYASWAEFRHQMISNPYTKEADMVVDGINRRQVEDRTGYTTETLVDELRDVGPRAIRNRQRLPWMLRRLRIPFGPPLGFRTLDYLTDIIYTRDQWMHRVDLARATGKTIVVTPEHDGRIIQLVIADLARKLKNQLGTRVIDLHLTGALEAVFRFGKGTTPTATIHLDVLEFNRLASGRLTPDDAYQMATVEGDEDAARWFLANAEVPF